MPEHIERSISALTGLQGASPPGHASRLRRLALIHLASLLSFFSIGASAYGQPSPVDTTDLGSGVNARMHMLLEKTIFRVDVLSLDIRLGPSDAARLDSLLAGRGYSGDLADSVAAVALNSRNVWARIEFKRDVSLEQFLGGIRNNLERAEKAGIVTNEQYAAISTGLPEWYAFLADRRILSGDQMFYRIRGDTLHTVFRGTEGEILLNQIDVGPERRLSVLGGYFAPASDFRNKLVKSLFDRDR